MQAVVNQQHGRGRAGLALVADQRQKIGSKDAKAVVEAGILQMYLLDQVHRIARPGDDVINVLEQFVALGDGQLVDAAGEGLKRGDRGRLVGEAVEFRGEATELRCCGVALVA